MSDQLPSMISTRRSFLATTTATASAAILAPTRWIGSAAAAPLLTVASRTIEVNGKAAKVFQVKGTGVGHGIVAEEGTRFSGALLNATDIPLQLHWHGQIKAPYDQDRARPNGGALAPGQTDSHDFALTPGTHWMHAHTLEEQQLLAAPMVALEKNRGDVQDVVVMLHDFAFRSPKEILAELGGVDAHAGHGSNGAGGSVATGQQPARGSGSGSGSGHMMGAAHANDVRYDAYLANDRTLDDPEVVKVDKGTRVRLRIINGSTATAYFVSTPGLRSQCVAVDGSSCQPVQSESYPLAQGQRIDLLVTIPPAGGAFPVLAQVEAERFLTGIVLATPGAEIAKQGKSELRRSKPAGEFQTHG